MAKKWMHGLEGPPDSAGYMRVAFGGFDIPEGIGGSDLSAARLAHDNALRTWCSIYARHGDRMMDESMTPLARLQSSAQYAKQRLKEAHDKLGKAEAGCLLRYDEAHKRVKAATAPPTSVGEAQIDAELRAYIRGLPSDKRLMFTDQACKTGDTSVMRAVASAHPVLSGLAPDVHRTRADAYAQHVAPDDFANVNAHREAVDSLEKARGQLKWHAERLIDFAAAEEGSEDAPRKRTNPDFPTAAYPYGEAA